MGYRHIDNLYKNQTILLFRECYALEKVHGTSAHVKLLRVARSLNASIDRDVIRSLETGLPLEELPDEVIVSFYSGGASSLAFISLFDAEDLKKRFLEIGASTMTIYGEAYGGSMQGMRDTYGDKLRFIAFEVEMGGKFLTVESADMIAQKMGQEFVPYRKISTDLASLDAERDLPSRVAVRRGITEPKPSEGVVLRPPIEIGYQGGPDGESFGRIIVKHKRAEFSERASKKDTQVDTQKMVVLAKAEEIAFEWVTPMRLEHVIDKLKGSLQRELAPEDTKTLINAMIEDVTREAKDEIVASKEAMKAIGNTTAKLFRKYQQDQLVRMAAGLADLTSAQQPDTSDPRR